MPARVVCTGLGVVTSIGLGKEAFWEGIVNTRCGARPLIRLNEPQFSKKFAYEIAADFPEEAKIGRASAMALQTAEEAIDDAGLDGCEGAALVIGTGLCDIKGIETGMAAGGFFNCNSISANVSRYIGNTGPSLTISTGCASGNHAIGYGFDLIRDGAAEVALVGGSDCVTAVMYGILDRVNPATPTRCQPFDADRRGVLLGDGAAFLVLEEISRAVARKAKIYGEIHGYGMSCDARHPTAPDREGMAAAMRKALQNSGTAAPEIDYIAMHGTGTILNDITETQAVKAVFGRRCDVLATSSIKAMTGHTGGAAGAVSAVATFLAMQYGIVPPTALLNRPDPQCDLNYTPNRWIRAEINKAMVNAFGFGGNNCCIVIGT
jgi:3-oxoacyl-[acyl-carrier-protein] synthase II